MASTEHINIDIDNDNVKTPSKTTGISTLFVRNIPHYANNQQLEEFFSQIGPVRSCFIVTGKKDPVSEEGAQPESKDKLPQEKDKDKGNEIHNQSRGFGFVQYAVPQDAQTAIDTLPEQLFLNKNKLKLEFAIKKGATPESKANIPKRKPKAEQDPKVDKKHKSTPKTLPPFVKITGIKPGITTQQLKHKVRKSGTVKNIIFKETDPNSGITIADSGNAIIEYASIEDAKRAVKQLNHHVFKGQAITADLVPRKVEQTNRLVVRNLSFKLREKDLNDIFSKYGLVEQVILPRKFVGGPLRGFAFITMHNREEAENALNNINGTKQIDRTVAVDWAVPKDEYDASTSSKTEEGDQSGDEGSSASDSDDEDESESDSDDGGESDVEVNDDNIPDSEAKSGLKSDKDESGTTQRDFSLDQETTFFVKNVSFETEEDALYTLFSAFGKVKYCRIVLDKVSMKSRGTAFVCFWDKEAFEKCYSENLEAQKSMEGLTNQPDLQESKHVDNRLTSGSVLLVETPKTLPSVSMFTIDGRFLHISPAISREDAQVLTVKNMRLRQQLDKRNTYLLREGVVFPNTEAAGRFSPEDLDLHQKYYGSRKYQISKNPNLYISKTRLCFRNIPKNVTVPELRKTAMNSIKLFKEKVRSKEFEHLSKDELSEGWDRLPKIVQVKILGAASKSDGEARASKSSGIGFVEFKDHAHSLACLRAINLSDPNKTFFGKNPSASSATSSKRMLFVEFAIENVLTLRKRTEKITNTKRKHEAAITENTHTGADEHEAKKVKPETQNTNRYNKGPGGFNKGPGGFNKGPGGFNKGPGGFNKGPGGFNKGPGGFNKGEDNQPKHQRAHPTQRNFNNEQNDKNLKSKSSKKPYAKKPQSNQAQFNATKSALKDILKSKSSS